MAGLDDRWLEKRPVIAEAVPEPQRKHLSQRKCPQHLVAAKPVAPVYHKPVMAPETRCLNGSELTAFCYSGYGRT